MLSEERKERIRAKIFSEGTVTSIIMKEKEGFVHTCSINARSLEMIRRKVIVLQKIFSCI